MARQLGAPALPPGSELPLSRCVQAMCMCVCARVRVFVYVWMLALTIMAKSFRHASKCN